MGRSLAWGLVLDLATRDMGFDLVICLARQGVRRPEQHLIGLRLLLVVSPPTIDKVCIDQNNIAAAFAHLSVRSSMGSDRCTCERASAGSSLTAEAWNIT